MTLQEALKIGIFVDTDLPIAERRHEQAAVVVLRRAARKWHEHLNQMEGSEDDQETA